MMKTWLNDFLDNHSVFRLDDSNKRADDKSPERRMIYLYGIRIGTQREESQWPIVESYPPLHCGHWKKCSRCDEKPGYDLLRYIGPCRACYVCFEFIRFRVAQIIRATLERFVIMSDLLWCDDVKFIIYRLLYHLLLRDDTNDPKFVNGKLIRIRKSKRTE